jgi:integrase
MSVKGMFSTGGSWAAPPARTRLQDPRSGPAAVASNLSVLGARRAELFRNAASAQSTGKWRAASESYEAFCARVGVPPLVLNELQRPIVMNWLDDKCDHADNATSVKHWISHLYSSYVQTHDAPSYNKGTDGPYFARVKAALAREYGTKSSRPLAITAAMLRRVYDALKPEDDPELRALWVHIVAAYHWLLRPNEHLGGDCVFRVRDVRILREAASSTRVAKLTIHASKGLRRRMAKRGEFEVTFTRDTEGPLNLIPLLERYIRDYGLAKTPDAPLFPSLKADGSLGTGYMSMDSFNSKLRALFARAGMPTLPSARGLRSGRRSDLANSGTPDDVVCQLGRWKSVPTSWRYMHTDARIVARVPRNNA